MKDRYIKAMDAIHRACVLVAGLCLVTIILIIPYGVFCRYALNSAASWPEPLAVLLMRLAKEAQLEERKLWYEREAESLQKLKEVGAEINDVADRKAFQAAVKPVWDKYGAQQAALIQRIQDVK